MDDDVTWGSTVWATQEPVDLPVRTMTTTKARPPSIEVPPPPTPFDGDAGFNDFDDFPSENGALQDDCLKDDDFGDFEDFEEAGEPVSSFPAIESFPEAGPSSWQPLHVDPLPPRQQLKEDIYDILAPIWEREDISRITTDDLMRDVEGVGQILVTPSSRETYKALLHTNPPTKPPNWTRSRIRRQHLISLGIPVNLDEMLPKASGKPLPTLEIHTRPMSAPPGPRPHPGGSSHPSRSGTPQPGPRNNIVAQFGPKPEIDNHRISKLLEGDQEALQLQSLPNLERMLIELKTQTASVSSLLTYLMQSRDALQQDSETYNGLIAELVSEVAQKVKSGKPGLSRTMSARRG